MSGWCGRATEWFPAWKARGWRKSDGKPVKNRERWEVLDGLLGVRPTRWEWTRGHAGHELNERRDALANMAIDKGLRPRSTGA
ncbi:MAG: hypothetical protein JNL61_04475 [Rhizobiaceae bacterium]|nr:hypothetical protein [Rhizobiaceae bacterium]